MSEPMEPRRKRRQMARENRKKSVAPRAALTLGVAALATAPQAQAANFNVTNLADSGAGSLRQALADANAAPGADTISFQAGLTGTITLTTGQLEILDSVDIQGPGAAALTINGNNASRVFYLYNETALNDVTISGLTITGGSDTFGAGIVDFGENLTLDGVTITANAASASGGGLAASGSEMALTIRNTTISGNTSSGPGGGIYIVTTGGPFVLETSVVSGNQSQDSGGGIYFYLPASPITFDRSTISGNTGVVGGGVFFYATLGAPVTITQTTVSGNSAYLGGGILAGLLFDPLVIESSTISGNHATDGVGGGIFLYYSGATFDINHSTIAANTATDVGGGIANALGEITLDHTLVGDNTGSADPDLANLSGSFAARFSLIETPGSATVVDNGGNVLNQDPQLGALGNHGGLTQTQVPAGTSPAVNAGDPAFAPPPATDQRGNARVAGGRIDIGAVELNPGTISLTVAAASVAENAGTVTITATRTGGSDGPVSVTVNTANGTAVAPGDYTAVSGATLSWADGDTANKTLNVTIIDDTEPEPDETFSVSISAPTGGAALGGITTEQVTISADPGDVQSIIAVPTLGDYGKILLTALFGLGGIMLLRRRKGLAAPVLAVSLGLGAAGAAQAAHPTPFAWQNNGGGAVQRPTWQATTLAQISTRGNTVTIRLADGTSYQITDDRFKLVDSRHGHHGQPRPAGSTVPANQPIVLKVRNGRDGSIHRIRIELFDTAAQATAAAARGAGRFGS